jgi:triacylglycerol lipase
MNIVLLHGIFDTARIFKRLVAILESEGHTCHAPSMKPADAKHGIHDLACSVERYTSEHIPHGESFAMIGFSMGGIVARQYMQVLDGVSRVPIFFSLACPHQGTFSSYLYFGQGARDLRPASMLLSSLKATESCLDDMMIHNYWTSLDLIVISAKNCQWTRADSEMDAGALLHRWIPRNPKVSQDIVRRLNELESTLHTCTNEA